MDVTESSHMLNLRCYFPVFHFYQKNYIFRRRFSCKEPTTPFHSQIEQNFIRFVQKYVRIEQNVESKIELNKIKLN